MISCSIIQKSELEGGLRLDAEYYQPKYIKVGMLLQQAKLIQDIAKTVDLQSNGAFKTIFDTLNDNKEKVIPYIRSENVGNFFVNLENLEYISREAHEKLIKTHTKLNDVLLARKGKIGGTSIITKEFENFNSNDNIVNIRIKDDNYNPFYLTAFFNCKYGVRQIERFATGNVQPWLSMFQVRSLKVPYLPKTFQKQIEDIIDRAYKQIIDSNSYYSQAENLLLEELGLKDYKVEDDLSYIIKLSDTKSAHRVDAEYFQPKYDKLISKIKNKNAKILDELVSIKKGIEPGSEEYQEEGKLFIRVSSLSKYGVEKKDQKYLSDELYQKLKNDFVPTVGEILLTKDATPGVAYVLKESIEGITAGGILRLKLKTKIEPEYLALVLNSIVGQMQAERDTGGSVIFHWRPDQIENCVIPILPKTTQQKIADLVQKSHQARKKSKKLLEEAKKKVEEVIKNNKHEQHHQM